MDDYPVKLGRMLFTMVDPAKGSEVAYNRWYERDHFYAGCMIGPYLFAGKRWVATRQMKDLRFPAESPFAEPIDSGSYLSIYWTLADHADEHFSWARKQVVWLYQNDRGFNERTHAHTALYDLASTAYRDDDGVPVELALDHHYAGLAVVVVEPVGDATSDSLRAWLEAGPTRELLDADGGPVDSVASFNLFIDPVVAGGFKPPMSMGADGGSEARVVQLAFMNEAPDAVWDLVRRYAAAVDAGGRGQGDLRRAVPADRGGHRQVHRRALVGDMAETTDATQHTYSCWIDGAAVPGSKGTYAVVNPATEEVVGHAPEASAADARAAAAAARAAFPAWSRTSPAERSALLAKAADLLEARQKELFGLVQAETGSTTMMTRTAQVPGTIARFRRYARGALEPMEIPLPPAPNWPGGPSGMGGGITGATAVRRPVGVIACITSYNVPMNNVVGKIGPALATGNTVVIKPAPQDPLGVITMVEIMHEAGFPPGVVNIVVGSTPESGEALVTSPDVDMVSFTGSTTVGRAIAANVAGDMKRLLLELGGKGASLVFDSADLERAAAGTASTFTFHAGQICTAPTRLIAQRGVYDEMVERVAAIASAVKVGDPTTRDTVVGPLISAVQRDRVESYVHAGIAEGGRLVAGGERPSLERGFFASPTVIADCTAEMSVVREEIFGPVVVALPFDDEEEGIALANATDFGLYDYVWTGDSMQGLRVAGRLRSGNVGMNTVDRNPETPFGGFKHSGVGRDGGSFALQAYTELQSVVWPG